MWGLGRAAGMSEAEFWESTAAKVLKLHDIAVMEPSKRRDFFNAQLISVLLNKDRSESSPVVTVEEILSQQYPTKRNGYTSEEWDDSMGAQSDWQTLKGHLKGNG